MRTARSVWMHLDARCWLEPLCVWGLVSVVACSARQSPVSRKEGLRQVSALQQWLAARIISGLRHRKTHFPKINAEEHEKSMRREICLNLANIATHHCYGNIVHFLLVNGRWQVSVSKPDIGTSNYSHRKGKTVLLSTIPMPYILIIFTH